MTPLEPFSIHHLVHALVLCALLLAATAEAQDPGCDCSCAAYHEMRSILEDMQAGAEAGEVAMPSSELQHLAACAGQCAMAWSQCNSTDGSAAHVQESRAKPSADENREPSEQEAATEPPSEAYALGEPRDDLERFHGVYGSDDQPNRDFFVTQASNPRGEGRPIPPGYLMIGAMWGDVAPWYMKSVGKTRFEQQWTSPGSEPLVVEFDTDAEGHVVSMRFVEGFLSDRGEVQRNGELPEGW